MVLAIAKRSVMSEFTGRIDSRARDPFLRVQEASVRISDSRTTQTGFWVGRSSIVTCAHGFSEYAEGDRLSIEWGADLEPGEGSVAMVDSESDVMVLSAPDITDHPLLPLSADVAPPDALYGWGYTARFKGGESITTEVEGWSRDPYLLKTKSGLVDHGMSGAPLYSLRVDAIVGMLRISRDISAPTGGRAILAATIQEICGLGSDSQGPEEVRPADLANILGIFESAYAATRPVAPVDRALFGLEDIPELREMQGALLDFEGHDTRREEAIRGWHSVEPLCLRFVVLDEGERLRRIGATCVLPLKSRSYQDYRAGRRREFDLSAPDIESDSHDRDWICFQSFAISHAGSTSAHLALRRSIFEHVMLVSSEERLPRVIAEIGTNAGLIEAQYFGMSFCGPSAVGRPLFEVDMERDQTWRRAVAAPSQETSDDGR